MKISPAEIENYPGYFIRRLQQMAVALFAEEAQDWGVTPVQYAALSAVSRHPGMDQRTLAQQIHFDTSTIGSVIDRLEARGWLERRLNPGDRRVRLLHATPEGVTLLQQAEPAVLRVQQRILAPLPPEQRTRFVQSMMALVAAWDADAGSNAPGPAADEAQGTRKRGRPARARNT